MLISSIVLTEVTLARLAGRLWTVTIKTKGDKRVKKPARGRYNIDI